MRRRHDSQEDPTAWPGVPIGLTLILALVVFGLVLEQVVAGGALTHGDRTILTWVTHHRTSRLTDAFRQVTTLGSDWVVGPIEAAATLFLLVRRRWRFAALIATVPIVTFLLTGLVKLAVARPRPSLNAHLVSVSSTAFPSGHASAAVACYLTLAVVFWATGPPGWPRIAMSAAALVLCAGIGVSRVYLGVHWTSDVIGGWLLGAIVLLALAAEVSRSAGARRRHAQDLAALAAPD
ncbi:MAG TPA: phosphatase PAP2 family protein [Acidimicrobiia bacterium]|nr:phosphatase PAP2 family protein [Acidimicrobiia bacterium]